MKTISRYIMTLALLITAATGAWAQGPWDSGDCTVTLNNGTLTVSGKGAMADYTTNTDRPWDNNRNNVTSVVVESGVTTVGARVFFYFENLTSVTLSEGLTSIGFKTFQGCLKLTSVTIPSTVTSIGSDAFYGCANVTDVYLYPDPANLTWNDDGCDDFNSVDMGSTKCHVLAEHLSAYQNKFGSSVNVTFVGDLKPLPGTVTLNDTKTEATFEMPTSDVTVDYELVRDMSIKMQAQVGDDPAKQPRYRVQWNEEKDTFEPAEMNYEQMMALFSVNDLIEEKTLDPQNYLVNIYAIDNEGNPTGEAMDFTNFTFAPGRYCVTASAQLDAPYDGTTAPSNIFELYQGYQVVIPAGEYVTYYKDEAVRLDEKDKNDIELCTITAVEDGKAVLSDNFDAMKANTPFLLKNTTTEEKTILLIPCNEPDLAVTVADEFIGTLTAKEFTEDDMATGDFYVCNGKEFIKVRGAGTLAANKAYLKVTGNAPASIPFRRSIGGEGEGTTGIDNLNVNDNLNDNEATWYDLNGRRLQGKPSQKGVYIKNGRKVVVH